MSEKSMFQVFDKEYQTGLVRRSAKSSSEPTQRSAKALIVGYGSELVVGQSQVVALLGWAPVRPRRPRHSSQNSPQDRDFVTLLGEYDWKEAAKGGISAHFGRHAQQQMCLAAAAGSNDQRVRAGAGVTLRAGTRRATRTPRFERRTSRLISWSLRKPGLYFLTATAIAANSFYMERSFDRGEELGRDGRATNRGAVRIRTS